MSSAFINFESSSPMKRVLSDSSSQRLTLQHIFNSCVLDKYQRVNAGELVRHFRFVTEQNTNLVNGQFDFAFLLNQLGGSEQQITFEQLFSAVENLYGQLVDYDYNDGIKTETKRINEGSQSKKKRNKENLDNQTTDENSTNSFDLRRRFVDHEKCKNERNELVEMNRRQTECLRMLEDEYKKLEDEHQRLQHQYEQLQKRKNTLEDELSRNSRYINENVDLHVHKSQIENSYRTLKEQFELNERDKFELQEQLISLEQLLQSARDERDQYALKYHSQEEEIQKYVLEQSKNSIMYEEKCHQLQQAIKQNKSLETTINEFNDRYLEEKKKTTILEKLAEDLRQQLRNAKTESIEARLSLSNLCDEESFLCDELEERVDVSRRITISNGQSLFAEINTMENLSGECLSQCLDSSNMENVDDMEVQILLSKSDSFNTIYLKDLFHELHSNGLNINEHLSKLLNQIQCDSDRNYLTTALETIDKHLSMIKNLIKKLVDNKDVFEGRFRKLQSLLIATREKQQKFQNDLKEISPTMTIESVVPTLKELQGQEILAKEKIRSLQDQLNNKIRREKKDNSKSSSSTRKKRSTDISPFSSLKDDKELLEPIKSFEKRPINKIVSRRSERVKRVLKRLQWCAIITSCSIVLFLWSVIIRYYCLTSPTDDDCHRLSFAWWPFVHCSTNGVPL